MSDRCYICGKEVEPYSWNSREPGARIKCRTCGEYRLSEYLATLIGRPPTNIRTNYVYSGAIREHHERGIVLWVEDLEKLKDSVVIPDGPLESIDRILLYVYRKSDSAVQHVRLFPQTDYPIAYAKDVGEFEYFVEKALELGYLEQGSDTDRVRLSLEGWKRVSELRKDEIKSNQAFVAMWFNKELDIAWADGFKPALEQTGYVPLRIDLSQHNEKIDDRIIAEIRKSGLLVADFTGQRGGVYFEAGFAMGLGKPVIWTCREDYVEKLHFDTRQYNHIVWTDPADLKEKLRLRIEATLPNRFNQNS
jgi:nucleoside 2-deoxyribosyltransferase/DNA-directed RNA polymerase subunit RPC12/RpoP